MERLEPVLKQKFWILLGVAIVMTFTGWWMDTARMVKAITERKSKIETAIKNVPSGEIPNESWAKKLLAINSRQDASNMTTKAALWKRQQSRMNGPQGLDPRVVPGKGTFTNLDQEQFRDGYEDEVRRVWKMLNPMDIDGSGVVDYPISKMGKLIGKGPWLNAPPESKVIWEIMEDLWLLEGLFHSIASVNGGVDAGRPEAYLHQIDKLELRGGGEPLADASAGGDSSGMGMGMGMGMGSSMGMGASRGSGGSAGGDATMKSDSAEFDPREEFGDDGSGASGGGAPMGMGMSSMMMTGSSGTEEAAAESKVKRYVQDDKSLPYKTRGFYLSVKMDHTRIPLLIAELTANENSVWPVEILRVQMSRLHEDESPSGGGMGGTGGAFSRSMPPGPSSMGSSMMTSMMSSGASSSMGGRRDDAGGIGNGSGLFGTGPAIAGNTPHELAAKALFENALKDPKMAQVTLCGVFLMFNEIDEVIPPKPQASTSSVPADEPATSNPSESDGMQKEEGAAAEIESAVESPMNAVENAGADESGEPENAPAEDREMPEKPLGKTENGEN